MPDLSLASRQIFRLFSLSWGVILTYRLELILWLLAISATPILSLAIWYAIATSSPNLSAQDILTYYLLLIIVRTLTLSGVGFELMKHILNGNIVFYLVRPPIIYWEFITNFLTNKIFQVIPLVLLALIFIAITPHLFNQNIFSINNLFLFALSLILATIISFTLDIAIGLTAFWLEDAQELMAYRFLLTQVASGVMVPFYLMPGWLHTALSFLPFRYSVSVPVEILMGQVQGPNILALLGIQLIWVIVFIILLRVLYQRGLKRYAIPGQ